MLPPSEKVTKGKKSYEEVAKTYGLRTDLLFLKLQAKNKKSVLVLLSHLRLQVIKLLKMKKALHLSNKIFRERL